MHTGADEWAPRPRPPTSAAVSRIAVLYACPIQPRRRLLHEILRFGGKTDELIGFARALSVQTATLPGMSSHSPVSAAALASRLRMIMGDRKLSRTRLSHETGISRPSLSSKLDGKVEFTYSELLTIAQAVDVPLDKLLAGDDDERPFRLSDLRPRPDRPL